MLNVWDQYVVFTHWMLCCPQEWDECLQCLVPADAPEAALLILPAPDHLVDSAVRSLQDAQVCGLGSNCYHCQLQPFLWHLVGFTSDQKRTTKDDLFGDLG